MLFAQKKQERMERGQETVPRAQNRTGLPRQVKAGVEALSGLSLESVRVHYASMEPARIGAAAFTRGSEIYIASGHEAHTAHEAWHVVQQMKGRVRQDSAVGGLPVNRDPALEREAETMGRAALFARLAPGKEPAQAEPPRGGSVQGYFLLKTADYAANTDSNKAMFTTHKFAAMTSAELAAARIAYTAEFSAPVAAGAANAVPRPDVPFLGPRGVQNILSSGKTDLKKYDEASRLYLKEMGSERAGLPGEVALANPGSAIPVVPPAPNPAGHAKYLGIQLHTYTMPYLYAADNMDVAVNAETSEPKEAYLSAALLPPANARLAAIQSPVLLEDYPGNSIAFTRGGTAHTLTMTRPCFDPAAANAQRERLHTTVCSEVANYLSCSKNGGRGVIANASANTVGGVALSPEDRAVLDVDPVRLYAFLTRHQCDLFAPMTGYLTALAAMLEELDRLPGDAERLARYARFRTEVEPNPARELQRCVHDILSIPHIDKATGQKLALTALYQKCRNFSAADPMWIALRIAAQDNAFAFYDDLELKINDAVSGQINAVMQPLLRSIPFEPGKVAARVNDAVLAQNPGDAYKISIAFGAGWEYHCAAVVAVSGGDNLTLENYNRETGGDLAKYRGIFESAERILAQKRIGLFTTNRRQAIDAAVAAAEPIIDEHMAELSADVKKTWFFNLHGSRQGQSFHEKQFASGSFGVHATTTIE